MRDGHGLVVAEFEAELFSVIDRLTREIGYHPTFVARMAARHGAVETCRRLIRTPGVSSGFARLFETNTLGLTIEALSLVPSYHSLFEPADRTAARRRLESCGFSVDCYLDEREGSPPF